MAWLKDGVTNGTWPWHLVGNQVIVTPVRFPGQALGVPSVPELLNSDQWDGYQADQSDLIGHLLAQPRSAGDVVVLTGDVHSSWAMDLPADHGPGGTYTSAGVEFVCPSVTSDGFYEAFSAGLVGLTPEAVVTATRGATGAIQATNPWIRYLDGVGHGYTVVDVTPERVQADFYLTPTPTSARPDPRIVQAVKPAYATSWQTLAGTRRVVAANTSLPSRADEPRGSESIPQQPGSHQMGNSVNGSLSTSRLP
jgi:phosphodiesterase/alkaline phosphatase D-like protein